MKREPCRPTGAHPAVGQREEMETKVPWVWSEACSPWTCPCVVCGCLGESGSPAQAVYTIVLMPLGLALLLVGGGGAGGCPWWCPVCPAWAEGSGGWP